MQGAGKLLILLSYSVMTATEAAGTVLAGATLVQRRLLPRDHDFEVLTRNDQGSGPTGVETLEQLGNGR